MAKRKVLRVEKVSATLQKSNPPLLRVDADGFVPTGGWTKGELVAYVYVTPPVDGIQEYDFIAEPPTEVSAQVLTPITARPHSMVCSPWVKGVRVYASENYQQTILATTDGYSKSIYVVGVLTDEGVECQAMRTDDDELYTLVGDLKGLKIGDRVYLKGTIVDISFCMQGTTIALDWISKNPPKCTA